MRISNVGMYVKNLEAAKDFFCDCFGAEVHAVYNEEENRYYSYILKFEEGAKLAGQCEELLDKAEQKVSLLLANGEEAPFEEADG